MRKMEEESRDSSSTKICETIMFLIKSLFDFFEVYISNTVIR